MVLDVNLIDLALIDQPIVLVIADLSFLASLKLLPSLFLDHCCVRIKVLSLQTDLFEFLGKACLLFSLFLLLGLNLPMHLEQALFTGCLRPCSQRCSIVLLFEATGIVLSFTLVASLFNFLGFFHQAGSFLLLTRQIGLSLEFDFLISLALVELETLTKLSNRHLFH